MGGTMLKKFLCFLGFHEWSHYYFRYNGMTMNKERHCYVCKKKEILDEDIIMNYEEDTK